MDVEMEDADVGGGGGSAPQADMGYEEMPMPTRRGSMSAQEQKERRASIKNIMADNTLSPAAKRRSIQHLMDGRRSSMDNKTTSFDNGNNNSFDANNHSPDAANNGGGYMNGTHSFGGGQQNQPAMAAATTDDADMGYGYAAPDSEHADNTDNPYGMFGSISNEQTRRAELGRPQCTHYDRKCTMIAPCCGGAFGCRICHDDCPTLPPKINNGGKRFHRSASLPSSFTSMEVSTPDDNNHTIDRFAVREIICRDCFTRQSSKANNCVSCGVQFGAYHCDICNLWMSNEEAPYHCPDCGFCRVGGRENFKHCHECGMCIDKGLYDSHNCKAGKYRSNCPVCQEYLFSSRGASHEMPCGHAIHWDCFRQLAMHDSRCPVCKKTAETRERMMPTWNAMAAGVAMQPVPAELSRVVNITCNDCERSEDARAWHFLGMQCSHCSSFNTVVDRIVLQGEEAHEFLEMNRQRQAILEEQQNQMQQDQHHDEDPNAQGGQNRRRRRVNRRRSAF